MKYFVFFDLDFTEFNFVNIKGKSRNENASSGSSNRVNRGGSWNNNADNCAVSNRNNNNPYNQNNNLGFRVVRSSSMKIRGREFPVILVVFLLEPAFPCIRRGLDKLNQRCANSLVSLVLVALEARSREGLRLTLFCVYTEENVYSSIFFMSQYQSFFISAGGNSAQCDELNHFLRSHVVIRTVENIISSGNNCGIQILVEYKDVGVSNQQDKKNAKIDWRASLATEEQRAIFDRLKEIRLEISKTNKLTAAYVVCKDEHLVAIITKPDITAEEIAELPNSKNIMLKKFAHQLYEEYQKILKEMQGKNIAENDGGFDRLNHRETANNQLENENKNEAGNIPF